MMSSDTQAALSGALEKARLEGNVVWGFIYWTNITDTGEEEYGFDAFDNHKFSERDLLRMTNYATKVIRKMRSSKVPLKSEPEEDPTVGGVN